MGDTEVVSEESPQVHVIRPDETNGRRSELSRIPDMPEDKALEVEARQYPQRISLQELREKVCAFKNLNIRRMTQV